MRLIAMSSDPNFCVFGSCFSVETVSAIFGIHLVSWCVETKKLFNCFNVFVVLILVLPLFFYLGALCPLYLSFNQATLPVHKQICIGPVVLQGFHRLISSLLEIITLCVSLSALLLNLRYHQGTRMYFRSW